MKINISTNLRIIFTGLILLGRVANATGAEVAMSAEQVRPLLVGQKIPAVQLTAMDGKIIELKELVSKKAAILVFYRGGWCPYCNLQMKDLKTVEPTLIKLGYQIIAISPDRVEELKKSQNKQQLNYALFSDSLANAAKEFGIAFKVSDSILTQYKGYGIDLNKASGETHNILPVPSVFIIGRDGEIKFQYVNPNYKVRLKADVLSAAARAYIN